MRTINRIFGVVLLLFFSLHTVAQAPPPPPGGAPGGMPLPYIFVLVAAGVGFGIYKMNKHNPKK